MRWLGTLLALGGAIVLAVDLDRGDVVVLELTASHGLHVSDGLGLVAILAGVALLLVAGRSTGPRRPSSPSA